MQSQQDEMQGRLRRPSNIPCPRNQPCKILCTVILCQCTTTPYQCTVTPVSVHCDPVSVHGDPVSMHASHPSSLSCLIPRPSHLSSLVPHIPRPSHPSSPLPSSLSSLVPHIPHLLFPHPKGSPPSLVTLVPHIPCPSSVTSSPSPHPHTLHISSRKCVSVCVAWQEVEGHGVCLPYPFRCTLPVCCVCVSMFIFCSVCLCVCGDSLCTSALLRYRALVVSGCNCPVVARHSM